MQVVLTRLKVQHQHPLHSIHASSWEATERLSHGAPASAAAKAGHSALTGISNISTIGQPETRREEGFPKQHPQNKCAKQGPLKRVQQEMHETALGPGSCPLARFKMLTKGEMSLHSGLVAFTSLFPFKLGAETFLPKSRLQKYHAFQKGRGASPVLSPFQKRLNPHSPRTPC